MLGLIHLRNLAAGRVFTRHDMVCSAVACCDCARDHGDLRPNAPRSPRKRLSSMRQRQRGHGDAASECGFDERGSRWIPGLPLRCAPSPARRSRDASSAAKSSGARNSRNQRGLFLHALNLAAGTLRTGPDAVRGPDRGPPARPQYDPESRDAWFFPQSLPHNLLPQCPRSVPASEFSGHLARSGSTGPAACSNFLPGPEQV